MFTSLEIIPPSEGIFAKIKERIKPPEVRKEYVQVRGGTPFVRLMVREDYFSWSEISSSLSGSERCLLADDSTAVPECISIRKGEFESLGTVLMMKTALYFLGRAEMQNTLTFSLYDRKGACVKMLKEIVPYVRYASVYTEKIQEYFYESVRILEESGMSIKINEYESFSVPSDIVVADSFSEKMKTSRLIFLGRDNVVAYNTVTGDGFTLPDTYEKLKGESTDSFLFASALYESCGVRSLAEKSFEKLRLAGKVSGDEKILQRCREAGNT